MDFLHKVTRSRVSRAGHGSLFISDSLALEGLLLGCEPCTAPTVLLMSEGWVLVVELDVPLIVVALSFLFLVVKFS